MTQQTKKREKPRIRERQDSGKSKEKETIK
jgi:hypothetical protein